MTELKCSRCKNSITPDKDESCWYCLNSLCYECWDKYGHCGHEEADKINAQIAEEYDK